MLFGSWNWEQKKNKQTKNSSHHSLEPQIIEFLPSSLIGDVLVTIAGIQGIEFKLVFAV